jgi:hypothetical protein
MARNNTFLLENIGIAPAAGTTITEYGDRKRHTSVIAIDTTLPAIAGSANLAVGKLIGTFPAGAVRVISTNMSVAITQTEGNITADTPDVGIGTVIGVGAVAVLGGTATFENIVTGQTAADCDGTATVKTIGTELVIETAGAHTIYLNVADGWAADGDEGAILRGTVTINWEYFA